MTDFDFDVVIVGAGIAGSILASKLASSNYKVLLLEAGDPLQNRQNWIDRYYGGGWPFTSSQFAPQQDDPGSNWKDPAFNVNYWHQVGPLAFDSTYERRAAGTTLHWLGTAMRFVPLDFKLRSHYNVPGAMDWPITYDEIEQWYTAAENEIGVAGDNSRSNPIDGTRSAKYPMPMVPQSYLDQQIARKLNGQRVNGATLLVSPTPQARNTTGFDKRPPCMGNTSCVPLCPIQAKYDASVSLKKALAHGATLWAQTVATGVNISTQDGDRISGVSYKKWDGSMGTVTARRYVLAAHAIETAKILLMSPWRGAQITAANSSDQVGRNLMDHVCQLSWGLTEDPVYPFRGPLSTSGIESFRDGPERQARAAYRIEIGNDGWSWPLGSPQSTVVDLVRNRSFGKALRTQLQNHGTRQIRMAFELESLPLAESRVQLSHLLDPLGVPRPMISYSLSEYTMKGYAESRDLALKIFNIAGIKDFTQIDKSAPGYFQYQGQEYQYRGAGHIIGTYRMGDSKTNSVVDKYQRSWDHKNLFLLGSGVFPTTGTANPTLTIAALSLWAAQTIKEDLS
jgi:glucose dehydrogenase